MEAPIEKEKNVKVKPEVWWKLMRIKVEYRMNKVSDVIDFLINKKIIEGAHLEILEQKNTKETIQPPNETKENPI